MAYRETGIKAKLSIMSNWNIRKLLEEMREEIRSISKMSDTVSETEVDKTHWRVVFNCSADKRLVILQGWGCLERQLGKCPSRACKPRPPGPPTATCGARASGNGREKDRKEAARS